MTPREELQYYYELAFYSPRLNEVWHAIKHNETDAEALKPMLDKALMLHQALPERGYASPRAVQRPALYQAKASAFHMVASLQNMRAATGCDELPTHTVPGHLVRDVALPEFTAKRPISIRNAERSPCVPT
ncbi:MAG: hypothetical protein ACOCWL_00860 [Thermoguttaceae bacterium]